MLFFSCTAFNFIPLTAALENSSNVTKPQLDSSTLSTNVANEFQNSDLQSQIVPIKPSQQPPPPPPDSITSIDKDTRILQLGTVLGPPENAYVTYLSTSFFVFTWTHPINALRLSGSLYQNTTVSYSLTLENASRNAVLQNNKILLTTLETAKYNFTELSPATVYYVTIYATLLSDINIQSKSVAKEVITPPEEIRNFRLIRAPDNPTLALKSQWAPPAQLSDLTQVTYDVSIQDSPKKNYKWELNTKTAFSHNARWDELTSGQKYYVKIRAKVSIKSPEQGEKILVY